MAKSLGYFYTRFNRIIFLIFIIALFFGTFSNAAVRTVTNLNDSGPGSLRDIIDNVAVAGDDIVFNLGLAGGTINLTSGILLIGIDLTVTGPADNPIILDANNNTRIISLFGGANVVLSNLVFQNGQIVGTMNESGGAIGGTAFPFANLEVNNCTFRNNSVQCSGTSCQARGGAMVIAGSLTVRGSTFENNFTHCSITNQFCFARAGAIEHTGQLPLILENNTFYHNQVRCTGIGSSTCGLEGGALYIDNDVSGRLNNNTFSHNEILCDSETCNVLGSTIFVRDISAAPDVLNTIIDNNPGVSVPNCSGPIADNGNNIQFPGNSCGGIQIANANLGPLSSNGGITQTQAIGIDSPAFNRGSNATCLDIDQRGVPRPQALICDIGSYELIPDDITHNVPTLSQWGLIAMASLLGIIGYMVARRRKAAV